jgi:hypothetical protein
MTPCIDSGGPVAKVRELMSGFSFKHRPCASLVLGLLLLGWSCPQSVDDPGAATFWRFVAMRRAIEDYRTETGALPRQLEDFCPGLESCRATAPGAELLDGWGTYPSYELVSDDHYLITSAGPDMEMGTGDDLQFSSLREEAFVQQVSGCYRIDLGWWDRFDGSILELSDSTLTAWTYAVRPTPRDHSPGAWSVHGDSLFLDWSPGGETTSVLRLVLEDDALVGVAEVVGEDRRDIRAQPVPCPTS